MAFLPDNNFLYPVLIRIGNSTGSGFFLNAPNATYLVTAKHVIADDNGKVHAEECLLLAYCSDHTSTIEFVLDFKALLGSGHLVLHPTADVAVIKMGDAEAATASTPRYTHFPAGIKARTKPPPNVGIVGMPFNSVRKLAQVELSNTVFLFGYPASLADGVLIDLSRPLLRRGIVAGKTGDKRILLDCPVYQGNSGGLVVEVFTVGDSEHYHAAGVATMMVPFVERLMSVQYQRLAGVRYENSGYAVIEPMDRVLELVTS